MSIQSNFPAINPTLNLSFALTKALDPRITFTRASTATYYGTQTAKAEENLFTFSQEFENAAWTNLGTTETANTSTAPDGTTTADTLDEGTNTSGHDIAQSITGTSGTTYTLSAFFKNVDRQFVMLACSSGLNAWASAKFDLTAGTAGSTSAAGAGWSTTSSSITSVGNSWFRCAITFVSGSTATLSARLGMATDSTTFTAGQRGLESYTGSNKTVFLWGAQLEQRSAATAYTPTTTQAITNYIPVLQTAASGVARFDHNPATFESLGLLIEEQRTNLLTYSEQFDNAAWTKTRSSITANTIVAPDGTLTGDKLVEDTTASASHPLISSSTAIAVNVTSSVSIYAKAGERTALVLRLNSGSDSIWGSFNLATGAVGSTLNSGTGSGAALAITSVGNGWYRCALSGIFSTTAGFVTAIAYPAVSTNDPAGASIVYTGNGYSGVYIWGAQLEAGAFPTSYIPTVASQVTRSADVAVMTGTNFSSWYNAAEGTVFVSGSPESSNSASYSLFCINDGTAANRITFSKIATSGNANMAVQVNNVNQASVNPSVWTTSGNLAQAFAVNNFAGSYNSSPVASDVSGTMPVVTQAFIGRRGDGASVLTGTIKKIAYYPIRVTNAQLQGLTS